MYLAKIGALSAAVLRCEMDRLIRRLQLIQLHYILLIPSIGRQG